MTPKKFTINAHGVTVPDRDPKSHQFTPTKEGSTACKWCPFNAKAHTKEG